MKIFFIYRKKISFGIRDRKSFEKKVRRIASELVKREGTPVISAGIIFCGDEYIREVNRKYLSHDYETDIITFEDADESGFKEGELLISLDTVEENAKRFSVSFENELIRVIIHGLLHLCGYQDSDANKKRQMRRKENLYMKI